MFPLKESSQGGFWSSEGIMSVGKDEMGRLEERSSTLRTTTIGPTHDVFEHGRSLPRTSMHHLVAPTTADHRIKSWSQSDAIL